MTTQHESEFKALHAAALTLSTKMIASLNAEQAAWVDYATKHGAKLLMQLGALPDCQRVEIVLLEREGLRTTIASIGANHG